jgi:hypothetical protein
MVVLSWIVGAALFSQNELNFSYMLQRFIGCSQSRTAVEFFDDNSGGPVTKFKDKKPLPVIGAGIDTLVRRSFDRACP